MPTKSQTTASTEADLEARIDHVVDRVFPWLGARSVRHQTKFSFKAGRKTIHINGAEASQAEARSDIILYKGETPLAVLELKRAGLSLTPDDRAQGLSYARMLDPMPPLVIVTNGQDLLLIETYSGKPWQPKAVLDAEFRALIDSAARVASADLKQAMETLMGSTAAVWMQAVRSVTSDVLDELTASWDEPSLPFAKGFALPRKATGAALRRFKAGDRLMFVEGAPLSGKSSILRLIALKTASHDLYAILYVEGGVGAGILQTLADALSRTLSWPVTQDEARSWLIRLSQGSQHRLVLAVDCHDATDATVRRELEYLSSNAFGPGLCLVVAVDESIGERLRTAPGGLTKSPIGRRPHSRVRVLPLDDEEFAAARRVLERQHIMFMPGAHAAAEYRQPWVLRAICASIQEQAAANTGPDRTIALLPLLSLDLITQARERFTDHELRRLFGAIAKAVVQDALDRTRDEALASEALVVNLVRRDTVLEYLGAVDLDRLLDRGFVRPAMHSSGDAILYIRLPELLASELAKVLAAELSEKGADDSRRAAMWLGGAAGSLPMGDVIAAQAIIDLISRSGKVSLGVIDALLAVHPKLRVARPGSQAVAHFPGVGLVEVTIEENGIASLKVEGSSETLTVDAEDLANGYEDFNPWLILSHLVQGPLTIATADGPREVDPNIRLIVGASKIVLRRPDSTRLMESVGVHDIPDHGSIVCHDSGIVEPITLSIFRFLEAFGPSAEEWIRAVLETKSMALLCRVHLAMMQIATLADNELSSWAEHMLASKLEPALRVFPDPHAD